MIHTMMYIPMAVRKKEIERPVRVGLRRWTDRSSPVKDQDLAALWLGNFLADPSSDGGVVEDAESLIFVRNGMMPRRTDDGYGILDPAQDNSFAAFDECACC